MPGDAVEIEVSKVERLRRPVGDPFPRQITVQVHLAKANRVRTLVAFRYRRHRADKTHIRNGGQRAHGYVHGTRQVARVHGVRDIQRAEVAGDILADAAIAEVLVELAGTVDLQNLRAEVAHIDAAGDRVTAVYAVLIHDVGIAGLELDLRQRLEEVARLDPALTDAVVRHHLLILFADADVAERLAVNALNVVRRKERHLAVLFRQLEGNIGDDHAERQRLDANFLVGVFPLGVEKAQNIGMVRVEPYRAGALTRAKLVGVGEGVLQHLHHRNHARRLVLDAFDRRAVFAQVREQKRHAAAAPGELQRGIYRAADRLHIVFDAQQETGDQLAALRQRLAALRQGQRHHAGALFEGLQIAFAVEAL